MKHYFFNGLLFLFLSLMVFSCRPGKTESADEGVDSAEIEMLSKDSTLYGICGEGTSMNVLQLITNVGDTLFLNLNNSDSLEGQNVVKGGLLCGDYMAVTAHEDSTSALVADVVINLTSLMGKWTSLDKNFELLEGGVVKSNVKAETNPWTIWTIQNGLLLLNADTFRIWEIGADSLFLENHEGIYVYKREK